MEGVEDRAHIFIDDEDPGGFARSQQSNGMIVGAWINVSQEIIMGNSPLDTFLHEIGHALGLHHPGPYEGPTYVFEDDAMFRKRQLPYYGDVVFPPKQKSEQLSNSHYRFPRDAADSRHHRHPDVVRQTRGAPTRAIPSTASAPTRAATWTRYSPGGPGLKRTLPLL